MHMHMRKHAHMHSTWACVPPQIEELPYDYYVCVGLTALLLPCMLALLSFWAPSAKGRTPRPKQKAK